jgi:hypothetical protein
MPIGVRFIRWGLGLLVFGIFIGFGIIGHYIKGAQYATGDMFMHNVTLWFDSCGLYRAGWLCWDDLDRHDVPCAWSFFSGSRSRRPNQPISFGSGHGKLDSIVRSWQARLRTLFELAEVPNGHPHRLRDTFAVELLLAGVPIERVSVLLGHTSVRITERHYNPWNKARQEQLEADLTRAWEQDPLVLAHARAKRTNRVGYMGGTRRRARV